jgi:nucleolar protein 56
MTAGSSGGWFAGIDPDATDALRAAIDDGTADEPADWPTEAVESGFASDREEYYDRLHEVTVDAAGAAADDREQAPDQQLVHAIRAADDCHRQANELAERVSEWGGSRYGDDGTGVEYARRLIERLGGDERSTDETLSAGNRRLLTLAERVVDLEDEARSLQSYVQETAPEVAPNLSMLAGPVLAARLISLAGGLESLAKKPSGTVQVLGAEDALFAHLRGGAPSPKHGIIYTHDAIRGTREEDRGSAARALAGKLSIAARIDHYSGDRRPELAAELEERIATIQAREDDDE